jgi:hypothetical protein
MANSLKRLKMPEKFAAGRHNPTNAKTALDRGFSGPVAIAQAEAGRGIRSPF